MTILLTGASSFTGYWFIRELSAAGHRVTAVFRQRPDAYPDELRRRRAGAAAKACEPICGLTFGDESFLRLVRERRWDLFAHHAADATNYKSAEFDTLSAVRNNTRALAAVLEGLRAGGCRKVLLTGSVFEGGEGAGSQGLPHLSRYGLSKALTAEIFQFECDRAGLALGKFVIPNPFGPYEEPRYTAHLMTSWLARAVPSCTSPAYVRDNIPVSLLARAYVRFAETLSGEPRFARASPSGYVESQGAFTGRLAEAMRPRLGLPCQFELARQLEFPEPRVRVNTDVLDLTALAWDEERAWDEMAAYYRALASASGDRTRR